MKVLHIISSPRAEGTVRLTLDWLQESKTLTQAVFALSSQPAELTGDLRARAAAYHEMPQLPGGWRKFPWMVQQARRVTRLEKPDLVICWNTGFSGFVLLGAFLGGARGLLAHAGNPPTPTVKGFLHGWMTASLLWLVRAHMVCCSRYVAAEFRDKAHFPSSILRVAWNCARVEQIAQRAGAARRGRAGVGKVVLMVATLEAHKDHATLLRAFVQVHQNDPEVRLRLAGGGRLRGVLEAQAQELGISAVVEFLGSRPDVPELLGQADLFVFSTTREEGLGTVLVEALAANLPIVASDVAACRELLQDGRWGQLVPAHDPAALAAAITGELRQPGTGPAEGERRQFLENFSTAKMQDEYLRAAGLDVRG